MTETYGTAQITSDLSFLLSLTKLFEADEKGYWYDPGADQRYTHIIDSTEKGKEIVIFQDPLPKGDHYVFNPYSEGFGKKSEAVQLFFKTVRIAFNLNLSTVLMYIVRQVIDHKEALAADDNDHKLSHSAVRMTCLHVDKKLTLFDAIDEKTEEEFSKILERIASNKDDDLIFVPYLNRQMTAKVMCDALTDPKWDEKFGKDIRKKSLLAFKTAIMGVLGIKDPSDLATFSVTYDPDLKTSARLWTTLTVYLKLYTKFNDVIPEAFAIDGVLAERESIDLGELQAVLDRSSFAYAIAKHMVQPVPPRKQLTDTSTVDTPTLNLSGGNNLNVGGPKFRPHVVDELGRRSQPPISGGLVINRGADTGGRFRPHVINDQAIDPMAPSLRPNSDSMRGNGLGFNRPNTGMGGSYFGNNGGGYSSGGLNLSPSSNFGSPQSTRRYF